MKKILLFTIFQLILPNIFGEASDDLSRKVLFRTDLKFYFEYILPVQDGISSNHMSSVTNTVLDYTDPYDPHHKADNEGRKIGSSFGGFKLALLTTESIIFPINMGKTPLLSNSNIALNLILNISPINFNAGSEFSFSPIPFLSFNNGFTFGTGWNIPGLVNGLAINNLSGLVDDKPRKVLVEDNFYGTVFNTWFSINLKFDTAIFMPENIRRWTHFVMQTSPRFYYITLISDPYYDGAYEWESDQILNGWYFSTSSEIGYQIPVIIDKRKNLAEKKPFTGYVRHNNFQISLLFKIESVMHLTHFNDSKMDANGWGSDFVNVIFGPLILFELPSNFMLGIGVSFINGKKYTDDSVGEAYYSNLKYEDWYTRPGKVQLILGYSF